MDHNTNFSIALLFEDVGLVGQNPFIHTNVHFFFNVILGLFLVLYHFWKSNLHSGFPFLVPVPSYVNKFSR